MYGPNDAGACPWWQGHRDLHHHSLGPEPNGITSRAPKPAVCVISRPDGGSSFVQVVTWDAGRCPNARTILTYSESENPASPHHFDQTGLFSRKRWVVDRFCRSQILASPDLHVRVITG